MVIPNGGYQEYSPNRVCRYVAVGELRPDCDPSRSPGTYSRTARASIEVPTLGANPLRAAATECVCR